MKTTTWTVGLCLFHSLVACGGSSASVDGNGDAAASGDGAGGADASADDASTAGDTGGPTDGGARDTAPADAPTRDDRIDPIVVGHSWTYAVTEIATYPACPSGSHSAVAVGQSTKDGKQAFEVSSFCASVPNQFYTVVGDLVQWDYQGTWVLSLDAPVQDGHTWTNGVTSYAWHDVGQVTVPAGTFPHCFKAQDTAGPTYTTFCRGVGPVDWHYRDVYGNGYDALLTAKSF